METGMQKILLTIALALVSIRPGFADEPADNYPSQPIHLIVPTGAGGITDVLARALGDKLGGLLKQTVIVENRPGASGLIGSAYVARAKPDGYTLLMTFPSHVVNPSTIKKMPYDTIKDFAPISKVGSVSEVLLVNLSGGIKTTKDLIAAAKAHPGKLSYGTVGVGSMGDLCMMLLQSQAGIKMLNIPYKSEPEIIAAIIRGDVQSAFVSPPAAIPMVKGNRVRGLAISDPAGLPSLPDTPSVATSGLAGYDVTSWNSILAPAKTPQKIIMKLNRAINQVLKDPALEKIFLAQGTKPIGCSPAELQKSVIDDIATIGKALKAAGIEPT
jgi:tripartite-type tricarboxylate transporter receptor subunit TctC